MITLRHFRKDDLPQLKSKMFDGKTDEDILSTIDKWNTFELNGRYCEVFAVVNDECVVGYVTLYQHNGYIISAGPEIFSEYRRNGYAFLALQQAYDHAKKNGYKIATAQVRKNNDASIKLHEKLGFVLDCEMINRRGKEVYVYVKLL